MTRPSRLEKPQYILIATSDQMSLHARVSAEYKNETCKPKTVVELCITNSLISITQKNEQMQLIECCHDQKGSNCKANFT